MYDLGVWHLEASYGVERVGAKSYTPSLPCMIWCVTPSDLLLGVGVACQIFQCAMTHRHTHTHITILSKAETKNHASFCRCTLNLLWFMAMPKEVRRDGGGGG